MAGFRQKKKNLKMAEKKLNEILSNIPTRQAKKKAKIKAGAGIAAGIAAGVAVGAVAGLLFAPKAGKETRADIKKKSDEVSNAVKEKTAEVVETVKEKSADVVDAVKQTLDRKKVDSSEMQMEDDTSVEAVKKTAKTKAKAKEVKVEE